MMHNLTLIVLITLTGCSATVPQPTATPPVIRTVEIRERDRPLISTPGSEYTVTLRGRVTDARTGELIPAATILVVTVVGSYHFAGGVFDVSFPAHTVVDIRGEAPGYKSESRQLKAHYRRNVTLDMEIRLERIRMEL